MAIQLNRFMPVRLKPLLMRVRGDWRLVWIALTAGVVVVRVIAGLVPRLVERVYARGVYVAIRGVFDYTIGLAPLPFVYVFGALAAAVAGGGLWRCVVRMKGGEVGRRRAILLDHLVSLGAGIAVIFFFFMTLWGYNYARPPVRVKLGLRMDSPSPGDLIKETRLAAAEAAAARLALTDGLEGNWPEALPAAALEKRVRRPLVDALRRLGYTPPGHPRLRTFRPGKLMLRLSVSGFYFPFTGEGYISAGLLPVERPFVAAHEMAHAYGFTDEGEANFLAWLACGYSQDPWIAYSGRLRYLMTLVGQIRRQVPGRLAGIVLGIPRGVVDDMARVREHHRRLRGEGGALARTWWRTYDVYLRVQGVSAGSGSYGQLVPLAIAWRRHRER